MSNRLVFKPSPRVAVQQQTNVAPNNATVFSQVRPVIFAEAITRGGVEELLKKFMSAVGSPLSHNGVILGHIKVSARLATRNDFLFLSLTRLDKVDVKASPQWSSTDCGRIDHLELDINVLIFGYSISKVETAVDTALQELRDSF